MHAFIYYDYLFPLSGFVVTPSMPRFCASKVIKIGSLLTKLLKKRVMVSLFESQCRRRRVVHDIVRLAADLVLVEVLCSCLTSRQVVSSTSSCGDSH